MPFRNFILGRACNRTEHSTKLLYVFQHNEDQRNTKLLIIGTFEGEPLITESVLQVSVSNYLFFSILLNFSQ